MKLLGDIFGIIFQLIIGGVVGWVAGIIMKSNGSTLRNIILGLVAGAVGGFLVHTGSFIGGLIVSIAAACALIYVAKLIFK